MSKMKERQVGVHVSIAGSLSHAFDRAKERRCDCFQIFTKNPRGWQAKPIEKTVADEFVRRTEQFRPGIVFAHISYLPNLASEKTAMYERSIKALCMELDRCETLHIPYLVTHLGHAGDNDAEGRKRVVKAIDAAISDRKPGTMLLLENTAGEKNSVGSTIEDIADVLGRCEMQSCTGFCFDTCHAFAAGYDLRDSQLVDQLADLIEDNIGLSKIHLIHLNDAKGELGSGLDRHEHIGMGTIGEIGIRSVLLHSGFSGIPCICETPVDDRRGDADNIRIVKNLMRKY